MALSIARALVAGIAVCFAVACASEDPIAKAEREYELVKKTRGDNYEVCEAARRIEKAALEAENTEKYEWWSLIADVDCQHAELLGRHG